MKKTPDAIPAPLLKRIVAASAVGLFCLLAGGACFLYAQDRVVLMLSAVICVLSGGKAALAYRQAISGSYVACRWTCTAFPYHPLRRRCRAQFEDEEGGERTLWMEKACRLRPGETYLLYFSRREGDQSGAPLPDTACSAEDFLGCENVQ